MTSATLSVKTVIGVSVLTTVIVNLPIIKTIGTRCLRLFFQEINIPVEHNNLLLPKVQTFLNTHTYGGSRTIKDNGCQVVKSGHLISFYPFSLISVRDDSINIWLYHKRTEWLLEYFEKLNRTDQTVSIYVLSTPEHEWRKIKTLEKVSIPLLYKEETIDQLKRNMDHFLSSTQQLRTFGKTNKNTLLFYGSPGTGKTFLTKWLAMKYMRDVYIVDPSAYFNENVDLHQSMTNLTQCQGGILLFEDIDRYFATLYAKQQKPNISKFLNFLDGLCTPDNIIIILTANYEGDIPESIRRDGRIDLTIHLPHVDREIYQKICELYQIDAKLINIIGDITTSELVKRIEEHRDTLVRGESLSIQIESNDSRDNISILGESIMG